MGCLFSKNTKSNSNSNNSIQSTSLDRNVSLEISNIKNPIISSNNTRLSNEITSQAKINKTKVASNGVMTKIVYINSKSLISSPPEEDLMKLRCWMRKRGHLGMIA